MASGRERTIRRLLMRRALSILATLVALSLIAAAPALAQIPPHQHFLTTPQGNTHEIASGIACAAHEPAFTNFHTNVDTGRPGQVFVNNPVGISASPC
jgi:hypothetical protein